VKDDRFIRSPVAVDDVADEGNGLTRQPSSVNAAVCAMKCCEMRSLAAADYRDE
jgi:hypothetical protein